MHTRATNKQSTVTFKYIPSVGGASSGAAGASDGPTTCLQGGDRQDQVGEVRCQQQKAFFFLKKKKIVERENEIKTKGGNWPPDGEKRDGSLKTQRKAALYLLVHLIPNGATTQFTSSSKSYIVSIVLP